MFVGSTETEYFLSQVAKIELLMLNRIKTFFLLLRFISWENFLFCFIPTSLFLSSSFRVNSKPYEPIGETNLAKQLTFVILDLLAKVIELPKTFKFVLRLA